jgi:DNA integrity scanning protein DisA with diadenylate cyclase activity
MKRSTLSTFFGIALLVLFAPRESQAQSAPPNAGGSKQDQVIQELLGEVRQLRIALQHISVNAYRGQVMVERLRLQQEQVNRLTQELSSIRNQIRQAKGEQLDFKERLDEAEKQQEKGVLSEDVVHRVRAGLEGLKRQEQVLSERENQVAAQLEAERANLTDLNKRLDALELEMMVTGQSDDSKKRVTR